MSRLSVFHIYLLTSFIAFILVSCDKTDSPSQKAPVLEDSHTRMIQLLDEIRINSADENWYLGDRSLREAKSRADRPLQQISVVDSFRSDCLLSYHLLRLGNTKQAINHLESAYQKLPSVRSKIPSKMVETVLLGLGVAYLRLAETENCVHCQTSQSCLLPIQGDGIHIKQEGGRLAIKYLEILLMKNPKHLTGIWLLNIAKMTVGEYPDSVPKEFLIHPSAFESDEDFPKFVNIAAGLGLDTFSLSGGTIIDDFNNDEYLDIVTSSWDTAGQLRYFQNNRDGSFSDQTKSSGLEGVYGGLNLIQADYDNDGNLDILVLRGAWLNEAGRYPNSLLRNEGDAFFSDVTFDVGLGETHLPTQTASWADFDNDGDLDLYIGNEKFPCQLFENDGDGHFQNIARAAGVENNLWSKGVVWGDYDGDRYPDLYVSNLDGPNRLYHNNQDRTFTDVAPELDVVKPKNSFPTWFWDFDNDGVLDLFVASYASTQADVAADFLGQPHNAAPDCLYQGDGQGGFREVAAQQNLKRVTQPMGCNFGDLDGDGFQDFYLGTGDTAYEALMPNLMFRNQGGTGFSNITTVAGFGHLQKGHGVAFADLDNDNDQDVFIELGGAFPGDGFSNALYENPGFGNHAITIRLVGKQSNRSAIGARIHVMTGDGDSRRSIYCWVNSGGSFGANPLRQQMGLGKATKIHLLEIFWPSTGQTQKFLDVEVDQFIEITEGVEKYRKMLLKSMKFQHSAN